MLDVNHNQLAVGIDMGGTNLRGAVVDHTGQIQAFLNTASPISDPHQGQKVIVDTVNRLAAQVGMRVENLAGLGLGIPGWLDRLRGELVFAPKMAHWQNIVTLDTLRSELGIPVYAASDPNVATLGELWRGAGQGSRNFIMVTLGTGLGCGIVIDGKLYVGHHGMAGEFGHIAFCAVAEPVCDCGMIGCLETHAAGPAIARFGQQAVASGQPTFLRDLVLGQSEALTTSAVFSAAKQGDLVAQRIVNCAGERLGIGFAALVSLFEPEKIIVGGGMSEVGDLILEPIRRAMLAHCYLVAKGYVTVEVVAAQLGDDAGVIGAAQLVFSNGLALAQPK